MFIVAINQPSIKNAHRLDSGYESSIEKPILSIYVNSIYSYCIMYKVDVEESSGERTSSDLISHASPPAKKAIRQFFLQISFILRRCEAPCTRLL